jgi:hypothetical protein
LETTPGFGNRQGILIQSTAANRQTGN